VAPYKITNQEVLDEMAYLQAQFGYQVHYNTKVDGARLKELEATYDAIFLGIGLGNTWEPEMPGIGLGNVVGATEFIEQLRMEHAAVTVPANVVVIGGGNTAMDAASESARLGAENVTLAYRRAKDEMGAYEFEYDLAKGVGVKGLFNVQPVALQGSGQVSGVELVRTEVVDGRVRNVEGSNFVVPCEMVILATGQQKQVGFLGQIEGLELDRGGRIVVNEQQQTTHPKYFAGGDAVNGGAEVVNAAAEGKVAAKGIHAFITGSK
jgi:glutamate synthase (NADPH/NADH) small chain